MSKRQKRRFMLLPQEHTVMVRQTSKWSQLFLLGLIGLGATVFATAWFYRLDEIITVSGILVPEDGGVEVKSPINGQLSEVKVDNGQEVEKGETLLFFDVKSSKSKETTLKSQLKLEKDRIKSQIKSNETRQEMLGRNIKLTEKILNKLKPLKEKGAISELQVLQQANTLETQMDELVQLKTIREELLTTSQSRMASLEGQLREVRVALENEKIISPIKGIVFDLKPDNDNYVATNAETLVKIVPRGKLGARINVENVDIGFVRKGQEVKVRVNSFPYTEYGEIDGRIKRLGADALPPTRLQKSYHFPVDISLDRSNLITREGVEIKLQAGMTINTILKLRDRRLIELLSDMFTDRSESLKRLRQP